MVEAADAGLIDLYEDCGWRVGQGRKVSLSAMNASYVGESQPAQTATLVLMHRGLYQLVSAVKDKNGNNRTTCSFVCGIKNLLTNYGYMAQVGSTALTWSNSARRGWANNVFRTSLPSDIRACFKQFKCTTAEKLTFNILKETQDYFTLPSAGEVFKGDSSWGKGGSAGESTTANSNEFEFNAMTRFTWYQTSNNRIKYKGDNGTSYYTWWERSPYYQNSIDFCGVSMYANPMESVASTPRGISPFGCI